MIADLNTALVVQPETEPKTSTAYIKSTMPVSIRVKVNQLFLWLNPKKWFSRFSSIDIDMSEFACKKTLPKE